MRFRSLLNPSANETVLISVGSCRRSTASALRPFGNPDQRNNQDENNRGSKKDIVQPHHRGLRIDREIEQPPSLSLADIERALRRLQLLHKRRIIHISLLSQPLMMQGNPVRPGIPGKRCPHSPAKHPRKIR